MIYTPNDLLKVILDTRAISIWDRTKGPVFWYTTNLPGPFYVNTEMVIGRDLSERMLREITAIITGTVDAEARAEQLNHVILEAFKSNPSWQRLIATMIDRAHKDFPAGSYAFVSGGERRDWLFSIPFAHASNMPHLFLFKNQTVFCKQPLKPGQNVLHVSDLINNAKSFFDLWQPALQKAKLGCCGNLCVNVRGDNGLNRLHAAGQKVAALMTIDLDFFRRLHAADLISRETFEEIAVFFASAEDWAAKYLMGKPELFNVEGCDAKSFERLRLFVAGDVWKMRAAHAAFFAVIQREIDARLLRSPAKKA
jgi:orotate phosphoribosyltransferase